MTKDVEDFKIQRKIDRSVQSSSLKDLEDSFENHARKLIQSRLYNVFQVQNFRISEGKELQETDVFGSIHRYNTKFKVDGEIDIYLGVIAPEPNWKYDTSVPCSDMSFVKGNFQSCVDSLNGQPRNNLSSPSSPNFPSEFNYYAIFEVTTQSKLGHKLGQLEYQLQYILAREFKRTERAFPPDDIVSEHDDSLRNQKYRAFVSREILTIVCFCGLVLAEAFEEKRDTIVNLVQEDTHPCLNSLMTNSRFIYFKSVTFSHRLENVEEGLQQILRLLQAK